MKKIIKISLIVLISLNIFAARVLNEEEEEKLQEMSTYIYLIYRHICKHFG